MSKIVRRVANKSVTSWQQDCYVFVMEFRKRHDTTDFCPHQLVTDLLRGSYGETGVMDFGFKRTVFWKRNTVDS